MITQSHSVQGFQWWRVLYCFQLQMNISSKKNIEHGSVAQMPGVCSKSYLFFFIVFVLLLDGCIGAELEKYNTILSFLQRQLMLLLTQINWCSLHSRDVTVCRKVFISHAMILYYNFYYTLWRHCWHHKPPPM